MRRHRICVLVLVCCAGILGLGLRFGDGQGYSTPVVSPPGDRTNTSMARRTLEVQLKNRNTGRPQYYRWTLSIPEGGSVEIECHEWTNVSFFGSGLFGFPRNSFRRILPLDIESKGVAEPYDFAIHWRR